MPANSSQVPARYYAAACQLDLANPADRRGITERTTRMLVPEIAALRVFPLLSSSLTRPTGLGIVPLC